MSYTYLIGWTKTDKWYYGVRYAKGCCTTDLWSTYFTSSKYVQEYRNLYGEPDVIQIRHVFKDNRNAIRCEKRVIETLRLHENPRFLNKAAGGAVFYDEEVRTKISRAAKGRPTPHLKHKTKEHIEKMRLTKTGVKQSAEHRANTSDALKRKYALEPHHCKGTTLSEEHKKNISLGIKNSQKFNNAKEKMGHRGESNGMYGRKHTEETKEKIRIKALARKTKNEKKQ